MTMYALMMICIGLCTNYPPSEGMLLFTAKADCEAAGEKMDGVKVVKEGWEEIGHLKHHCLVATAAHAEDHNWHVLIVTSDGKVSLLKGMTKFDAEHTRAKLQGYAYTKEEKAAEANARAQVEAAIEKSIRAANAACPDLSKAQQIKDTTEMYRAFEKTWDAWKAKYGFLDGCLKADGSIEEFQRGGMTVSTGFYYKQIEVFQ